MTIGEEDERYFTLTSMLHWKNDGEKLRVCDLDRIFNEMCNADYKSDNQEKLIYDLIFEQAEICSKDSENVIGLENKIVLSIAIRLLTERFIISKMSDPSYIASIKSDQTAKLAKKYREEFSALKDKISVIDQVVLMTPENIHINSFMYEPIIDMSNVHLQKLYGKVKAL